MASLPAHPPSQRRSSPEQNSTAPAPSHAAASPVRSRTDDSQTLFENSIGKEHHEAGEKEWRQEKEQEDEEKDEEKERVKEHEKQREKDQKCWICFADASEDTPETSAWRSPCACALVAHEDCLLDWIADMEAPTNRRARASLHAPRIECPQCKGEIALQRPKNGVVEAVRALERVGAQFTTPASVGVLFGAVFHSSMAWGVHSIYAVFGADDGFRLLRPLLLNRVRVPLELDTATARDVGERLLGIAVDHLVHWRLYLGLPLITPILVLSRTSLADSLLPVLPILFFATQTHAPDDSLDFAVWPPSASLAFAVLPYVRSAYNAYYKRVWADAEKRWLREIQPRAGQGQTDGAGDAVENEADPNLQARDDDENVFEVRIDGNIWEEWEEEEEAEMEGNNPPAAQQDDAQAQDDVPAAVPGQPQPPAQPERRLSFSPTAIAETVLGALVFPSIASLSGDLLRLVLPRAWTAAPASARFPGQRVVAKGLLQEKWARSLLGGCLFVVLKDAVMLYVRWKMADMHRRRRVLDYRGKRAGG